MRNSQVRTVTYQKKASYQNVIDSGLNEDKVKPKAFSEKKEQEPDDDSFDNDELLDKVEGEMEFKQSLNEFQSLTDTEKITALSKRATEL